jgi:hypothetical protein
LQWDFEGAEGAEVDREEGEDTNYEVGQLDWCGGGHHGGWGEVVEGRGVVMKKVNVDKEGW